MSKGRIVVFTCIFIFVLLTGFLLVTAPDLTPKVDVVNSENLAANAEFTFSSGGDNKNVLKDGNPDTVWTPDTFGEECYEWFVMDFGNTAVKINTLVFREKISYIDHFVVRYFEEVKKEEKKEGVAAADASEEPAGEWVFLYEQDKMENYHFAALKEKISTKKIKVEILSSKKQIGITGVEAYNIAKKKADFRVSAYVNGSVLDGNLEEKAKYYNTVTDAILFLDKTNSPYIKWDIEGEVAIKEENLKTEVEALREINPDIKIVVEAMAPGATTTGESLKNHTDKIVEKLAEIYDEYKIDGFDFDWEYPSTQSEWDLYSDLFVKLRKALPDAYISVALSSFNVKLSKAAIKALSYVQIMGYDRFDFDGNNATFRTGHFNPVKYFVELGYPREKLIAGLPFYAREGETQGAAQYWADYKDIVSPNFEHEYYYNWFENSYPIVWKDQNMTSYINGPQCVYNKTAWSIEQGLAGIMIFRFYEDLPYDYFSDETGYSLTRTIQKAIDDRIGEPEPETEEAKDGESGKEE